MDIQRVQRANLCFFKEERQRRVEEKAAREAAAEVQIFYTLLARNGSFTEFGFFTGKKKSS